MLLQAISDTRFLSRSGTIQLVNLPVGIRLVVPTALSVNCELFLCPELRVEDLDCCLALVGTVLVAGVECFVTLVVSNELGSCVG